MAASRAASAIAEGLRRVWPGADLRLCPMADGGEGTLDTVLSRGGQRLTARVSGASGKTIEASYGIVGEGKLAIVEAAQIVGLTDPDGTAVDVEQRSSRGIGELMAKLLDGGLREFMVGLGGTSTNDGGAGMLAALARQAEGRRGRLGVAKLGRKRGGGRTDPVGSPAARRRAFLQVSMEQNMGCAVGACLGCVVMSTTGVPQRVCREGPVFASEELAWEGAWT